MPRRLALAAVAALLLAVPAGAGAMTFHDLHAHTGNWKGKVKGGGGISFRVTKAGKRVSRFKARAAYKCTDADETHSTPGGRVTMRRRKSVKILTFGPFYGVKIPVSVPGLSHKPKAVLYADDFYSHVPDATVGTYASGGVMGGFNRSNGDVCHFGGRWKAKLRR